MALPREIKDFVIHADGVWIGEGESARLPKLAYKVDEWIGGGMAGPIEVDQHLEKMDCEWTTRGFSLPPYLQFGSREVGSIGLRFTAAIKQADSGAVDSVEVEMRGTHKEIDSGDWKRGEAGSTKVMSTLTQYRLSINGVEEIFVDFINGIERYHGVDVRSDIRQALGLT